MKNVAIRQKLTLDALTLVSVLFLASACSKNEPTFSSTPAITFRSLAKYAVGTSAGQAQRDSVVISITFKDGDGDLGEDLRDTTRLKQTFANQQWGNYQIRTLGLINGKFEEVPVAANAKLFFQLSTPQRGPLEGTLDFSQTFPYQSNAKLIPVKFQIRLRDRQLNESNLVETDTVRVPLV